MEKKIALIGLVLLTLFIALSAFMGLGELPIRIWDESRLAVSAIEMYENGFSLIVTFENSADLWSTKPPLLIWLQTSLMHLIGPSEEAVRIPSAIAVVVTALSLVYFSKRITGKYAIGVFASLALITCSGFNNYHSGRSGDYDALLSMFMTLASLLFFVANQNKFANSRENVGVFILLALGVLTKSIAALLFTPAYFLLLLHSGTLFTFFKKKSNYLGLAIFIVLVGGYYLGREYADGGYLEAVWMNDLFGRYATSLDDHKGPFSFYIENFVGSDFKQYYLLSLLGLVLVFYRRQDETRTFLLYCATIFVVFILIISMGQTKLSWYLVPAFPFAAILCGGFLGGITEMLDKTDIAKRYKFPSQAITLTVVLFVFFQPYYINVKRNYKEKDRGDTAGYYNFALYLKDTFKKNSLPEGYSVLFSDYAAHQYFYVLLHQSAGTEVDWKHVNQIKSGEKVITGGQSQIDALKQIADFEVLWEDRGGSIKGLQILSLK